MLKLILMKKTSSFLHLFTFLYVFTFLKFIEVLYNKSFELAIIFALLFIVKTKKTIYNTRKIKYKDVMIMNSKSNKSSLKQYIPTLLVIVAIALALTSVVLFRKDQANKKVVMYVGEEAITETEYGFYYSAIVNSYYSIYKSFFDSVGLDVTADMSNQSCPIEGYDNWKQYFMSMTSEAIAEKKALSKESIKQGFEYDASDDWNKYCDDIKEMANESKTSVANVYKTIYGPGATEERIKSYFMEYNMANAYEKYVFDNIEIQQEEIDDYYESNPSQYDSVTYMEYVVYADVDANTSIDEMEKQMDKAKDEAKDFFDNVYDEESFTRLSREHSGDESYNPRKENIAYDDIPNVLRDWLYQCDQEKQTSYIKDESLCAYRIVYFISRQRNDEATRKVRHILISPEIAPSEIEASEESLEAAKKEAQSILDSYMNGEQTEEAFAKLASNSDDKGTSFSGGMIESMKKGIYGDEIDNWVYSSDRKEGEVALIKSDYGYHVVYYIGENEPTWILSIRELLKEQKIDAIVNGLAYDISYPENSMADPGISQETKEE